MLIINILNNYYTFIHLYIIHNKNYFIFIKLLTINKYEYNLRLRKIYMIIK